MYFPCFLNRKRIKMPKSTQNLQPKSYVVKCAKIEQKKKLSILPWIPTQYGVRYVIPDSTIPLYQYNFAQTGLSQAQVCNQSPHRPKDSHSSTCTAVPMAALLHSWIHMRSCMKLIMVTWIQVLKPFVPLGTSQWDLWEAGE